MLYTRKGDDGTTRAFACDQRFSKSSAIAEALGALDEANSFLGIVKTDHTATALGLTGLAIPIQPVPNGASIAALVHDVQEKLFIIQAEVAGANKSLPDDVVSSMEATIDAIEKTLPPINSFFISGGTTLAARLDFARTLIRRAERRVVAVSEGGIVKIEPVALAYLNRSSSLLYALARLTNHISKVTEDAPRY